MKGPIIRSLPEMIAELEEEVRRTEEWRKAQGLPKRAYHPASHRILADFERIFNSIVGKREEHDDDN